MNDYDKTHFKLLDISKKPAREVKRLWILRRIDWLDQQIVRKQQDIMLTYHYVQNKGKLMMESRENSQISQFGQFFNDFEVIYLQIAHFSEK